MNLENPIPHKLTFPAWLKSVLPVFGVLMIFNIFVYAMGLLPDYYSREDFLIFHFAETHGFLEAIWLYFLEFGRIDSVYWTLIYKISGYQPAFHHFISLVLNLIGASIASLVIFRVWPRVQNQKLLIFAFVASIFANPFTMSWSVILSGDNSRTSIIAFFVCVLFMQEWARSKFRKWKFFIAGFLLFSIAVFNYENIALMFPVALVLAFPMFKEAGGKMTTRLYAILGGSVIASFIAPVIPVVIYSLAGNQYHPALRGDSVFASPTQVIISAIEYTGRYFYLSGNSLLVFKDNVPIVSFLFILLIVAVATYLVVRIFWSGAGEQKESFSTEQRHRILALYFSSIWMMVFTLFPYAVVYNFAVPTVRFYSIAVYGLSILAILIFDILKKKGVGILLLISFILVSIAGIIEFGKLITIAREREFQPYYDYLPLLDAVPQVKPNTSFFLVDFKLGTNEWRSCSLALRMLYDEPDLNCAYMSTQNEDYWAERYGQKIYAERGGWFRSENWIILGMDENGEIYIIPELTPESDVVIDWINDKPIETTYERIISDPDIPLSGMALKLMERWEKFDTQD